MTSDGTKGIEVQGAVAVDSSVQNPMPDTMRFADGFCSTAGTYDQSCFVNAISALPSCTLANWFSPISFSYSSQTFDHCGTVIAGAHSYTFASQVSIYSPFVKIQGASPVGFTVEWTGATGAAFYYTSNPYTDDWQGSGGLFDVHIDGKNGSAGTYGLETNGINGFRAAGVTIANFTGSGSAGWLDTNPSGPICYWNEKYDVEMSIENSATGIEILGQNNCNSFGYGRFELKLGVFSGQTGFLMNNAGFGYSMFHLLVNQVANPANATAFKLTNHTSFLASTYQIHIETPNGIGSGNEVYVDSTSVFTGIGVFDQSLANSNSITGSFNPMTYPMLVNGHASFSTTWSSSTGYPSAMESVLTQSVANTNESIGHLGKAIYTGNANGGGHFLGLNGIAVQNGAGTVQGLYGTLSQVAATNSGTVANGYGSYVRSPLLSGGGNFANVYGSYIASQSQSGITNAYGVYQAGASDQNYFSGPATFANKEHVEDQFYIDAKNSVSMTFYSDIASQGTLETYDTSNSSTKYKLALNPYGGGVTIGGGAAISNSDALPQVRTPIAGQAACIKSPGPPVVIGYCSTAISSSGACTCN